MNPEEFTIAEALKSGGYTSGIFGKWHLGDHYPLRPQDPGFDEVLVFKGGQFSPPHNKTSYYNPIPYQNGVEKQFNGYCNDIWFSEAEKFIRANQDHPFFALISTNLPHGPLSVPDKYSDPYLAKGIDRMTAKCYGMVLHVDMRFGSLLKTLHELKLDDRTMIIFLSDNGPAFLKPDRYMTGLRGKKEDVYDGGIRVPCVFGLPGSRNGGRKIDQIAAHIDIFPTILDAAKINLPTDVKIDGLSLLPILERETNHMPDRYLHCQAHLPHHSKPQIRRAFMVRNQRFKLVQQVGFKNTQLEMPEKEFKYELFNILEVPGEEHDIAIQYLKIVEQMRKEHENWYEEVVESHPWKRAPIFIGSNKENPMWIEIGYYRDVKVVMDGWYEISVEFKKIDPESTWFEMKPWLPQKISKLGTIHVQIGDKEITEIMSPGSWKYDFKISYLKETTGKLDAWVEVDNKKNRATSLTIYRKGD